MKRNVLTSEPDMEATSVPENQVLREESLASGSQPTVPSVDSIIEQVRRDASRGAVKYLLRSDVGHDGE